MAVSTTAVAGGTGDSAIETELVEVAEVYESKSLSGEPNTGRVS